MERVNEACARLGIKPRERLLAVSIRAATLRFYRGGTLARAYPVSTSRRPPSNVKNSLGTPRGLHEIAERIGAGQPPGGGREADGQAGATGRSGDEGGRHDDRAPATGRRAG